MPSLAGRCGTPPERPGASNTILTGTGGQVPFLSPFFAVDRNPSVAEGRLGLGLSMSSPVRNLHGRAQAPPWSRLSLASGELIARRIQTPQGREFVSGLKVGDIVQLDYKEAAALSIETP